MGVRNAGRVLCSMLWYLVMLIVLQPRCHWCSNYKIDQFSTMASHHRESEHSSAPKHGGGLSVRSFAQKIKLKRLSQIIKKKNDFLEEYLQSTSALIINKYEVSLLIFCVCNNNDDSAWLWRRNKAIKDSGWHATRRRRGGSCHIDRCADNIWAQ